MIECTKNFELLLFWFQIRWSGDPIVVTTEGEKDRERDRGTKRERERGREGERELDLN